MKRSKRYKETQKSVDRLKTYDLDEALEAVIKNATAKFDEGVEIHLALGIDPKQSDQLIRGTITFPHSVGKGKKIAVFAEGDKAKEAKEAGAEALVSACPFCKRNLKEAAEKEEIEVYDVVELVNRCLEG